MSKRLTAPDDQLRRVIGARPGVIETLNRETMSTSYWPVMIYVDEDEAMLAKGGTPKAMKSWSGAMNAARRMLKDMQQRAKAELDHRSAGAGG